MDLRRDDLKRTARAPAKLNLFLDLLGRRDDGFHEVETLMVPIRLADSVSFLPVPSTGYDLPGQILLDVRTCWPIQSRHESAPIPAGSDNLVVRALQLLRQRSGCEFGARVELVKRIPAAAGLGGGSSDAAAALRLANRGWQIQWTNDRLAELAAEIGSDVPFFLSGSPAICRGRGERTVRLPPIVPMHFVVVKPPIGLNTGDVYRAHAALAEHPPATSAGSERLTELLAKLANGRGQDLGRWMQNRLQKAASLLSPWVDKLPMVFDQLDFVGHQLSGSGSAYFGVCRHAQHARRLATILRTRQLGLVYATRSCP
jgi:4-diphosphocytidyl-2-C-methyl-D-erythritol kinase